MNSLYDSVKVDINVATTDVGATTKQTGTWVNMRDLKSIAFLFSPGTSGLTFGTVIFALEQATDGSGTGAKAITGASLTHSAIGTVQSEKTIIEVDANSLDNQNDFFFVAPTYTYSDVTGTNNLTIASIATPNRAHKAVNCTTEANFATNIKKAN